MGIMQEKVDRQKLAERLTEVAKDARVTIMGISVRADESVAPGEAHLVMVHQHRMLSSGTCADCGKHWDQMADGEWQQATIAATITGL